MSSHTLLKIKQGVGGSLKLKGCMAPHGSKDDLRLVLRKDYITLSSALTRVLECVASTHGWKTCKTDVKAPFLHTGEAQRGV